MESARETGGGASSATASLRNAETDSIGESGVAGAFTDTASAAARQARKAASSLASDANDKMQEVLDFQVEKGADLIENIADSVRIVANELDRTSPQLADLARGAADRIGGFSDTVRAQSASELIREGADFARRQPAIVFGAAALIGFGLYRLFSLSGEEQPARRNTRAGSGGQRNGAARHRQAHAANYSRTEQDRRNRGVSEHGA